MFGIGRGFRPGFGLGGVGSGFGFRPGLGFGRPGFGRFGFFGPFALGAAVGAAARPPYYSYPYPYPYPYYY